MSSPSSVPLCPGLVALQGGTSKTLVLSNAVIRRTMGTFGGSVATMAMLADICEGRAFAVAFSKARGAV